MLFTLSNKLSILLGKGEPALPFKLFSTIIDISDPMFSFFNIFSKLVLEFSSIDKGETAKGAFPKRTLDILFNWLEPVLLGIIGACAASCFSSKI